MAEIHTRGPADLRRAPLEHLREALDRASASADRIRLQELAFTTQVGVRAVPGSPAHGALEAVLTAVGAGLPAQVGEVRGDPQSVAALWLAPDEFLVLAPADSHELLEALTDALGEHPGQVVDLSANRTVLDVTGVHARDVLEKGVPTDLHPRSMPPGRAVTATLGTVPVLLWRTGADGFRLLPRISFADHVARWLLDASHEHLTADITTDQPEEATCPATVG